MRSSAGIDGRPARLFNRQKIRQPSRCQRTMVDGRTLTTESRQSHSLVNSARLTRVGWSMRRGLTPRSIYRASCRRRTRFSARIEDDERRNSLPTRTASAKNPMNARNMGHMCASCQIQSPTTGALFAQPRVVNYCGPQESVRRRGARGGALRQRPAGFVLLAR